MRIRIIDGRDDFLTDETPDGEPVFLRNGVSYRIRADVKPSPLELELYDLVDGWLTGTPLAQGMKWCPLTTEARKLADTFLRGSRSNMPVEFFRNKDGKLLARFVGIQACFTEENWNLLEMTPLQIREFAQTLLTIADDCENHTPQSGRVINFYEVQAEF